MNKITAKEKGETNVKIISSANVVLVKVYNGLCRIYSHPTYSIASSFFSEQKFKSAQR